ncbi:MAG TPA: transcriptional repressor [Candidatus Magasanikbacteria bacterium]|jgi:Fe2+ or Zn2+ uptake regulation protein|nr:transcriptional repressor [Candidatus Magasanikbacteria bacterium]HQF57417.1 transcriptional repressor [Candidatus Magasanikbacteria bacterium]HQL52667.1 transcriptional repressor [Candidatus Magasanikbacteria bacterium]
MNNNWIIEKLKENKIKITIPRQKIAIWLDKKNGIFCASEINKKIKTIDRVSTYRTLDLFQKEKIITPIISLNGEQFYEKNNDNEHHHHIICTKCHKTECIECTKPKIKKTNFKNLNHSLIFTGLCQTCAK